MDQMGSQNGMDELEVIDADTQKVIAMVGALPRVEAPSNFEFRVKAALPKDRRRDLRSCPFSRRQLRLL
jgi:hypothetical protein